MDVPNSHPPFEILLVEDNPADVELTTSDREEDVARCYKVGANSYLTKPVQFDDCLKLVEDIQQYWLHISKLPPKNKTVP